MPNFKKSQQGEQKNIFPFLQFAICDINFEA